MSILKITKNQLLSKEVELFDKYDDLKYNILMDIYCKNLRILDM